MTRMLRRLLLIASLLCVPLVSACGTVQSVAAFARLTPTPVQMTVMNATAIDAANQLGEVVEQLRAKAHTLHQLGVLPIQTDNMVQRAAIQFATDKDRAVTSMADAQTPLMLAAAAAPLAGSVTSIITGLQGIAGAKLPSTGGLIAGQLPALQKQAQDLLTTLKGPR